MERETPKGETVWIEYTRGGVPVFWITSKPARDFYFLYEILPDGKPKRLGKARSPRELEERFSVEERMLGPS